MKQSSVRRAAVCILLATISFNWGRRASAAPAKVTLNGSVVFPSTSTLEIELGGSNAPTSAGTTYDQLVFNGVAAVATIQGPVLKVVLLPNPVVNQHYRAIDTQNGGSVVVSSFFAGLVNHVEHDTGVGIKYVVDADSSGVNITFTQVPEPAFPALAMIAFICKRGRNCKRIDTGVNDHESN